MRAAAATFLAFVILGALPLLAFILELIAPGLLGSPFVASAVLTGAAFFVIGALRSRVVGKRWYTAGFETLAIGGLAAVLAYIIGAVLRGLA